MISSEKVNCDFYFGGHSGERLLKELGQAKEDITIVSPYVAPEIIDTVINAVNEEIPILLITHLKLSDLNDQKQSDKWRKILQQRKIVNEEKLKRFKKLGLIGKLLLTAFILLVVLFFLNTSPHHSAMPFLLMGTFSLIAAVIISKIKSRVVVFTYEYLSLINLVLLPDPYDRQDSSHPFVHAKIFVIDKSILYTGSLNFTRAGMYSNIETRIRIDNKKEIARIYETIISYKNSLNAYHLDQICKSLYHEPVN